MYMFFKKFKNYTKRFSYKTLWVCKQGLSVVWRFICVISMMWHYCENWEQTLITTSKLWIVNIVINHINDRVHVIST
jgi:hypothetical protein